MTKLAFLLSLSMTYSVLGADYCATFQAKDAGGVDGIFSMNVENGTALYRYNLDVSSFDPGDCDLSEGLSYHIHTYWTNTSTTSGAGAYCGASYTGGHFDPNLACSASSQSASTLCVDIGRTVDSVPSYAYSCSGNYETGHYAYCEVGDLSGKFGLAMPNEDGTAFDQTTNLVDYMPPYIANYKTADEMSYPWQSVVFHCKQGGTRLFCAELIEGSDCDMDTKSNKNGDDDDEWSVSGWNSLTKLLLGLGVVAVVGLLVGGYVMKKRRDDAAPLLGNKSSDRM